jgi:hypothetical protein
MRPLNDRKDATASRRLAKTAAAGILSGLAAACSKERVVETPVDIPKIADSDATETPPPTLARRAEPVLVEERAAAECCRGHNECKGKGNCKIDGVNRCKGLNDCKGKGGCKSSDCYGGASEATERDDQNCCAGMNQCKALGNCKTAQHNCKALNACKGQGGCKPVTCP